MNDKLPNLFGSKTPLKADGHLSDEWLLLSLDGELSASDHALVKDHVRACWSCRARREQLERTIEEIVEYEHVLIAPYMPPPRGGEAIFRARLNQLAVELGNPSVVWRWPRMALHAGRSLLSSPGTWATSAAVILAIALYVLIGREKTPIVSANQLLQRATASETGSLAGLKQPVAVQKVSIKAGSHGITRTLYRDTVHKRQAYRSDVSASDERAAERDFERSSFKWDAPLSPQAYSQWRNGVAQRKDVVTRLNGGLLRLDTAAGSGPLAEASLTVRASDYHAVAEELRLRDNEQIEVVELSFDVVGLSTLAPDVFSSSALPGPLALPPVPVAPSHHATLDAVQIAASELQVRAALHSIGADMGEQITVRPTAGGLILVEGIAEDEARRRQMLNALVTIPHTSLRLTTVAQMMANPHTSRSPANSDSTSPVTIVTASPPLLEDELKQRFPDGDQRTEYVNLSLSLCQSASARAWALTRLADRYTSQRIALLDPEGQRQLRSLLTDHITTLREDVSRLQNQLGQVLSSASNTAAANTAPEMTDQSIDWRSRAHRIHSSVETTNESVSVLLAGPSETTDSPATLQLRLRTTLTQLQSELQLLDQQIHKQL
jgi:hypothetical protein